MARERAGEAARAVPAAAVIAVIRKKIHGKNIERIFNVLFLILSFT